MKRQPWRSRNSGWKEPYSPQHESSVFFQFMEHNEAVTRKLNSSFVLDLAGWGQRRWGGAARGQQEDEDGHGNLTRWMPGWTRRIKGIAAMFVRRVSGENPG